MSETSGNPAVSVERARVVRAPRRSGPPQPTGYRIWERRAWDRRTLESRDEWRWQMPNLVIDEFLLQRKSLPACPDAAIDTFEFDPSQFPTLDSFACRVRECLLRGDGVALITGLRSAGLSDGDERLLYMAIGTAIGQLITSYGRLYKVTDRGKSHLESSIPVSQTNATTGFHTDSSAWNINPDFVALHCETPGLVGGDSLISNALQALRVLRDEKPDALNILGQNFARDVVTPGMAKNQANLLRNQFPIFAADPTRPTFRYMRYWIEQGHRKLGKPLRENVVATLDLLDEILGCDEHAVQFKLDGGDMLFLDNKILTHNRTDYEDSPTRPRCLHRMWVNASSAT